jgi:integrase/recombinase XerD
MRRVLKTIYIDAGYPDASSHSGRRSMITRLAEKGIDVNSIRIIAGHSSLQTTQRYIEQNPARLANILKGL